MSNTRLQNFRSFLTEHFTALAVEVFSEVESIIESCYEENKRLRDTLHMVLSPEIKLIRIDARPKTEATTYIKEMPVESNNRLDSEVSDPLIKRPKEEPCEFEINWGAEQQQQQWPGELDSSTVPDIVKDDPEQEEADMEHATNSFNIEVVEYSQDDSATLSPQGTMSELEEYSSMSDEAESSSSLLQSTSGTNNSQKCQTNPKTTKSSKPKPALQKTLLQLPRMVIDKSMALSPAEQESFISRIYESFKDLPDDQKPLITKIGLKEKPEMVHCAFGEVPKGSPLSYLCPLLSSQDFLPYVDPPPQPPLPLFSHLLERLSVPTVSAQEQEHLDSLYVSWQEAHNLELSTRGCKELAEKLRKMRLTNRFRDICKLKPGQSHGKQLVFKIKTGRTKRTKILSGQVEKEEELKLEAIRDYCQNLCINFSACGLVVHPHVPWLGATPDGVVYDPREKNSYGLLHTKYVDVRSFVESKFLVCRNEGIQLKRDHSSYWQIQGEMMVTGMSWCDLLLHSKNDMLVQRIYRDEMTIKCMNSKLKEFFFYYYLPGLN